MDEESAEIAPGITVDRKHGAGKAIVKGTRVRVEDILRELADGALYEDLEHRHGLSRGGLLAAILYAAETVEEEPRTRRDGPYELSPGVTQDARFRFGKAVLAGTRMDIATILYQLAAGESFEGIEREYSVAHQDIKAAMGYAYSIISRETVSASR